MNPILVEKISLIIAQSFYPYGDRVWKVTGKETKLKCEHLSKEIIEIITKEQIDN